MDRDRARVAVRVLAVKLDAFAVREHVDREHDGAHAGELGAARLHVRREPRVRVVIGGRGNRAGVAVRGENDGMFPGEISRAIKIAGDEQAGGGFEGDVFDGVAVVGASVADARIERSTARPRGEAGGALDARAEMGGVGFPRGAIGKLGEGGVEHGGALRGREKCAGAERGTCGGRGRETGGQPRHIGAGGAA